MDIQNLRRSSASDDASPVRPLSLREQLLWSLFGLALTVSFLALLFQDQVVRASSL